MGVAHKLYIYTEILTRGLNFQPSGMAHPPERYAWPAGLPAPPGYQTTHHAGLECSRPNTRPRMSADRSGSGLQPYPQANARAACGFTTRINTLLLKNTGRRHTQPSSCGAPRFAVHPAAGQIHPQSRMATNTNRTKQNRPTPGLLFNQHAASRRALIPATHSPPAAGQSRSCSASCVPAPLPSCA